jgi:zinc carboxypeptidase
MTHMRTPYPIGTPGLPWGDAERAQWLARQVLKRSYANEVVARIDRLSARFAATSYGQLDYSPDRYRLLSVRNRNWREDKPLVLITGGVHGYETSGVHGALEFLEQRAEGYVDRIDFLVAPCVNPWGYERIHRWNPHAIDPNRSFRANSPAEESAALIRLVSPLRKRVLVHIDLHETTDSDETEFRPALAARDGTPFEPGVIPDGFYLVANSENRQLQFQQAIIGAVAKVTHIALPDQHGQLIGSAVISPGVIEYAVRELGLCTGITNARYTTTTEVYPDSPRASPEQCNAAQVTAVCAAIEFALR